MSTPTRPTRSPRPPHHEDGAGSGADSKRRSDAATAYGHGGAGRRPGTAKVRLANPRRRARALFIATLFIFSVFAAQLVRLQGLQASEIAQRGRDMRVGDTTLPAPRGAFTDANGVVLAGSEDRYSVIASPRDIKDYERKGADGKMTKVGAEGAAQDLAPLLGMSAQDVLPKLQGGDQDRYSIVKKGLDPLTFRKVLALKIPGISQDKDDPVPVRNYPGGAATAPLVGWVGGDGTAAKGHGGGLEMLYNDKLTGRNGRMSAEYASDGTMIPVADREITPAVPGSTIKLTLDNDLQWYAYNAIAGMVQAQRGDWGVVVVMDKQGHIRTAAQYPSFDPKHITDVEATTARPFQTTFEPGSTAKVVTIGASLDQGITTPTSEYTVPPTRPFPQLKWVLNDSHTRPGDVDFTTTGILAVSSNIGTTMIADQMSAQTLYQYQRKFGMNSTSAVGFPGESEGILTPPEQQDGVKRYTVMFGQGLNTTAMQVAGVYQAIANGGVRIPPTLVEGMTGPDGKYVAAPLPDSTQALKADTSKTLLHMMENVTDVGGTAVGAEIPGYRVAGKTGTADIPTAQGGGVTASFVGIAPADDPQLICGVFVYRPRKSDGSENSAPVFKSVMTYALQKYKIPPTGSSLDPYPNYWGAQASRNTTR